MEVYWNPQRECMSKEELRQYQTERLISQVHYVYENSPFYRQLYDRQGVQLNQIRTIEDFVEKIPIVRKEDLRAYQAETDDAFAGLRCVPTEKLIHIWCSTGTTGKPTLGAYTVGDLQVLTEMLCRDFFEAGIRPGMQAWSGAGGGHWLMAPLWGMMRRMRLVPMMGVFAHALTVPRLAAQLRYIHPEAMPCVTTEMMSLLPEAIERMGLKPPDLLGSVRIAIPMGEPVTPQMLANIQERWGDTRIILLTGCAAGESYAVGAAGSCSHEGGHVWGDIAFTEVVDPDTGVPVSDGERGELVATNLLVEGVPYIRFGTEDLTRRLPVVCERGIAHPVYDIVYGRTGWRVPVQDREVLPFDVDSLLQRHPETATATYYLVKPPKGQRAEKLVVRAAYIPEKVQNEKTLKRTLEEEFQRVLRVPTEIEWVEEQSIPRAAPHKLNKVVTTF